MTIIIYILTNKNNNYHYLCPTSSPFNRNWSNL